MTTTYWVSPDIDAWRVQREGAYRAEKVCPTREEGIDWACRFAADHTPSIVKVQDYGGNVTAQFDFQRHVARAAAQ